MPTTQPYKYGHAHRKERARQLAAMPNGHPCARCHHPMWRGDRLELDHAEDGTTYLGLSHRRCNQLAGASKGGKRRAQQRRTGRPAATWTSRPW